jgi:hypothetical protein
MDSTGMISGVPEVYVLNFTAGAVTFQLRVWTDRQLDPKEIDKNSYHAPVARERSPRDMPQDGPRGWVAVKFVRPRLTIEGLTLLTKGTAERERAERLSEAYGFRRRYPKTKNYFVIKALNYLFQEAGLAQFCVEEAKPVRGSSASVCCLTD